MLKVPGNVKKQIPASVLLVGTLICYWVVMFFYGDSMQAHVKFVFVAVYLTVMFVAGFKLYMLKTPQEKKQLRAVWLLIAGLVIAGLVANLMI